MLKKFKAQLYAITLSFSVVSLFLLFFASLHHQNRQKILNRNFQLKEVQKLVIQDNYYLGSFLLNESATPEFYLNQNSYYFVLHQKINGQLGDYLTELANESVDEYWVDSFSVIRDSIHSGFLKLIDLQIQRGFQDYGMEGKMRQEIHHIEQEGTIDKALVLMLRRHEKDYIIRHQQKYIDKHQELMNEALIEYDNINPVVYVSLINYALYFEQLIELDKQIGRMGTQGLVPQLNANFKKAELLINGVIHNNNMQMERLLVVYRYSYWSVVVVFFAVMIFISVYISNRASRQLHFLGNAINTFVRSGFKKTTEVSYKENHNEIHTLTKNFTILQSEILDYIQSFEEKVDEQTFELRLQKKEIVEQNTEILAQRDKMQEQVDLISYQHKQLETYNTRLTDSIFYAKHIQQALLPSKEILDEAFSSNFIYFVPKDVLSGDYYWLKQCKVASKVCIAVADCTGHGVPGALLSMLGISFMNEIFNSEENCSPAVMLNQLRNRILDVMTNTQTKKSLNDGMDIGLAEIDYSRNKLIFAGANRDVYIIRDNELIVMKGDNMPVGKYVISRPFVQREFQLQDGDNIYLFTDGYNDQFGGTKNEKFKRKNFKKLLLAVQSLSFEEQLDIINRMHKQWRKDRFQIDDILIIGFQYNANHLQEMNKERAKLAEKAVS
jgi:serine phosphatase RsbU (regulator of sigma subunit)